MYREILKPEQTNMAAYRIIINIKVDNNWIGHDIILSAVTHTLNISGHVLICTYFPFGMWNWRPKFLRTFQLHSVYMQSYIQIHDNTHDLKVL
jgi:hypothetical protein